MYAGRCVYANGGCVYTGGAYTHPLAYTQVSAYTHPRPRKPALEPDRRNRRTTNRNVNRNNPRDIEIWGAPMAHDEEQEKQ